MKGSWTKFWTITGLILVILLTGTHVSAFMNPVINIQDVAGLRYDGVSYPVNDTLIFNGTVNPDGGETVAIWRWEVREGPLVRYTSNAPVYRQMIPNPGTFDVTLTVTSDTGIQETATQRIVMNDDRNDWGLISDYIYSVDRTTPLMVSLIDQSQLGTGTVGSSVGEIITNWYWILDGEKISENQNPSEVNLPIEMESGTHVLSLRIDTNLGRKSFISKPIQINPMLPNYVVTITTTADNGGMVSPLDAPMTVHFGAQASINGLGPDVSQSLISGWEWYLGDDPVTGEEIRVYQQNPSYTYEKQGRYRPTVGCILYDGTIVNPVPLPSNNWIDNTGTFVIGPPLEADFYWEPLTPNPTAGYLYRFIDTSYSNVGINRWSWNFGDGMTTTLRTGDNPNVTHLFKEPGTYAVTLDVQDRVNPFVPNITEKTYFIEVLTGYHDSPMKPSDPVGGTVQAGFTATLIPGASDTFRFTDTSFGPVKSWNWNFGDGTENSTVRFPPDHRYMRAGTFKVVLTVSDGTVSDSAEELLGVR